MGHIRVIAEPGGGHYHGQALFRRVALDAGAAQPDAVIVAHAVQKVERGAAGGRTSVHADHSLRVFGQNDIEFRFAAQTGEVGGHFQQGHNDEHPFKK